MVYGISAGKTTGGDPLLNKRSVSEVFHRYLDGREIGWARRGVGHVLGPAVAAQRNDRANAVRVKCRPAGCGEFGWIIRTNNRAPTSGPPLWNAAE